MNQLDQRLVLCDLDHLLLGADGNLTQGLAKGRLCNALTKLSRFQWEGRICGGIAIDSACVLKLVSTIHTKGKIMLMLPRIKTR